MLTPVCCWMCSTVAGPSENDCLIKLLFQISLNILSCHQPDWPASFLAEFRASLMAKRTLILNNIAGSPVARIFSYESWKKTLRILVLPLEDITPIGFLAPLKSVTLKS